jgi:predicted aconitase
LAAAIVGRTPEYGLHLDENRVPTIIVEVELAEVDYSLLGQAVGAAVGGQVPLFRGISPTVDELKSLAAAMAAAGSVALFHVEGITPEAGNYELRDVEKIVIGRGEIEAARNKVDTGKDPELIALGCPHLSVQEIRDLAMRLKDRRRKGDAEVWFCTSRCTAAKCPRELEVLGRFGKVVCDTCMVVTPIEERFHTTATNSGKACSYLPTLCSQKVVYRTTKGLLEMIS